jgi:Flp pilus assembly protein TadG
VKRSPSESAQATVEFALALPLFLLVVLALIDFSRLLFAYVSLADGTREMVRTATISRSASIAAVASFNNFTLLAGNANPATDQVVITVADQSCVSDQRQGHACAVGSLSSATCTLPLQPSCVLPPRASAGGGYIQVDATYSFVFSPLFQNNLANVADVSFMRSISVLTTSARAYLE